jgi:ribosome-binding factor A
MPKEFSRTQRIAELLQRELAIIIQREVKDPRLDMVTVSAVEVTSDLSYAKIFVTILCDDVNLEKNLQILNQAASFLRTLLAKRLKIRTIPQLSFIYDKSISEGSRLSKLIDMAVAQDEGRASKKDK